MTRAPSIAGVILAAGESSRMGRDKALLPWPPSDAGRKAFAETFLSAAIRSFSFAADFVVVVVGSNEALLAPVIYACGASLIANPDPARGQFSSLQAGLREVLNHGRDAALVTLVDHPPATVTTIRALRDAFFSGGQGTWAVVPEYSGKHGHPYLAGREMIEAFLRVPASATARDVEHTHREHIQYLPVDDPFVVLNVNTPEDLSSLPPRPAEP